MINIRLKHMPEMIRTFFTVLVLLIGAGADLHGQYSAGNGDDPGPITTLISLRDEVGLTATQVQQLRNIDIGMDVENQPLVARLVELRSRIRALGPHEEMTPESRALFESYIAEARPLMRQIRENNESAMEQVGAVLTEAQKDTIARLLKERYENRDRTGRSSRSKDRWN